MKYLFLILLTAACSAQTYTARTDVTAQPYPVSIPCPSSSSCAGGGALTGANYQFTPTDFPTTPIVRITDVNTTSNQHTFNTSCDASSEVNNWNTLDNRFTICGAGQHQLLFSFNTATNQATQDTSFNFAGVGTMYFSYTQPYIMYHVHLNASNDLAIFSYDTTSLGNPTPVQVADLGTACSISALQGNSSASAPEGVTVSGDDQTFGIDAASSGGQSSSGNIYAIAWNRTTGCSYWNTATGHVFVNGVDQGAISPSDKFTLHNVRLGKGGTWLKVQEGTCLSTCTSGVLNTFWQAGTTTVNITTASNSCGHTAAGYNLWVNKCNGAAGFLNGMFSHPYTTPNSFTSLPTTYPSPQQSNGAHITWANDNSSDTNPFFAIMEFTAFTTTYAWDNELLGVATDGSGTVWRFAHSYATPAQNPFVPGAISQDGKYLLWTTDWDGMVGNTDNVSSSCTPGTNCRTDVFPALLPTGAAPPSGSALSISGAIGLQGKVSTY